MFNTLKAFGMYAMFGIASARGCVPSCTHEIRYVSRHALQDDVFLKEKLKTCSPYKRARIIDQVNKNLKEDHISDANREATINATLRGVSCP